MKNIIYICGLFRSGTTLLGKCIGNHPNIAFALDPALEIFREIRNQIYPTNSPDDLFSFEPNDYSQCSFIDLKLSDNDVKRLKTKMTKNYSKFSPLLFKKLNETESTFPDIYTFLKEIFYLIDTVYGRDKKTTHVGFKEVWGEEFASALLDNFQHSKVVHILRDPRGVVASSLTLGKEYSVDYLCRFWNKSAGLAKANRGSRYMVVRYEDLVWQPRWVLGDICRFLNIGFDERMLCPVLPDMGCVYERGANSSYSDIRDKLGFRKESVSRWMYVLPVSVREQVVGLTSPLIYEFDFEKEG